MADDPDGDDLLFERLQQSASGDAAVRQLRRRYDLLRRDYEHLLDRLGEIEDRLSPATMQRGPAVPEPEPAAAPPEARSDEPTGSVGEGLIAPLLKLRDEYLTAVSGIQSIVTGLDGLAAAALKGQHTVPAPGPKLSSAGAAEPADDDQARAEQGSQADAPWVQVDVKGPGFGALLDFQERLSKLAGVGRVSIKAIDNERATLIVEFSGDTDQH